MKPKIPKLFEKILDNVKKDFSFESIAQLCKH